MHRTIGSLLPYAQSYQFPKNLLGYADGKGNTKLLIELKLIKVN